MTYKEVVFERALPLIGVEHIPEVGYGADHLLFYPLMGRFLDLYVHIQIDGSRAGCCVVQKPPRYHTPSPFPEVQTSCQVGGGLE